MPQNQKFFRILISIFIALILGVSVYVGLKYLLPRKGLPTLANLLIHKMPLGIHAKQMSYEGGYIVLDSLEVKGFLVVERLKAKKDVLFKLQKPGQAADLLIQNARLLGLCFKEGALSVKRAAADIVEVRFIGALATSMGVLPCTAQGEFHLQEGGLISRNFRFETQGVRADFDSLLLSRRGECQGRVSASVTLDKAQGLLALPLGGGGRLRVSAGFQIRDRALKADGLFSSDTLRWDDVLIAQLEGRFEKRGARVTVPAMSLRAFGGRGSGRAELVDSLSFKRCEILLDLKGADLNRVPARPEGLAFEGRYNGRLQWSGEALTWPEVLRKMKSD
jgi:hypothetical protein